MVKRIQGESFCGREVQLDGHARRVLNEQLMQAHIRNSAFAKLHASLTQTLLHARQVRRKKRDVVNRSAAMQAVLRLVAQVIGQSLRIVHVHTDEVDRAVVGFVASLISPNARKVERWTKACLETQHVTVELPRGLKVGRSN